MKATFKSDKIQSGTLTIEMTATQIRELMSVVDWKLTNLYIYPPMISPCDECAAYGYSPCDICAYAKEQQTKMELMNKYA